MKILVVIAVLLSPSMAVAGQEAPAEQRSNIKWLIAGMIAAQAADIATTTIALQRGCVESTYYGLQNKWAIGGMKGGGAIALSITLPFAHKNKPKLTRALLWAQIASGAFGAAMNTTRMPHC